MLPALWALWRGKGTASRTRPAIALVTGLAGALPERTIDVIADAVYELWERIAMLLPPHPTRRDRHPGRLRVPDRVAPAGIVYVLRKGVAWRDVPAEVVDCSGITSWRRLRDWTEAGAWPRLHQTLPAELRRAGLPEMDDCAIDGPHVRALKGEDHTGPSPVDRARPGPSTM